MSITYDAIDLFAGAGGWDIAAKQIGLRVMGIEWDEAACLTRKAAGLNTIKASVLDVDPAQFIGTRGLIASPPCQTFSMAGKGEGRKALDDVLAAIDDMTEGRDPWEARQVSDERTRLVLEPLRWAMVLQPEWIAWEQVPTVLPVWERCADVLRSMGYAVATGNLQAEQYGVPQTRKRAVLVARRAVAELPEPTHTKYSKGKPRQAGDLLPWVSMAEALGWGQDARPSMTVTGGGTDTGGAEPFGNAVRQGMRREADAGRFVVAAGVTGEGRPARRAIRPRPSRARARRT